MLSDDLIYFCLMADMKNMTGVIRGYEKKGDMKNMTGVVRGYEKKG